MGNNNRGIIDGVKCGRCETLFDITTGVILTECNHVFCKKCFNCLFHHNPRGFFKCLNAETGKTSRCQKLVARTAVKEIYNIDDYLSHIIVSVTKEEKISEDIPSIQNEPSFNNQHVSIQNEPSFNNQHVSVQNEPSVNDRHESTLANEASTSNKYYFSIGQNEQSINDARESTSGNEESTSIKNYFSLKQLTKDEHDSTRGKDESTRNEYHFSTGQKEQSTSDLIESTRGNEESTSDKYYVSTVQNENTKNRDPSFNSENQEPETSRSNAEKEHEEPMSHQPKNYQDATQCRNPECKVWLFYGEQQYSKKSFTCPDCKQRNCFMCKGLHNLAAINCAEYKKTLENTTEHSEDLLKKMLENNEAMLCPTCKETLLKDDGCDFITCFWCKVELCWATRGYRWGAWGPGDTSGGCRCGVDGIKCHPHCRGCH